MGIMVTGSSLGGVVFPIMISRLIQSTGCPWAIRSAGFLILGLQIIAALTIRPRTESVLKKMSASRFAAPFKEISLVMLLLGIFIPIVYLAAQGFQEAHTSEAMAQYLVSIFNAKNADSYTSSLFGRLAASYGADLIEIWNIFIIACTLCGISEFAPWIPAKQPCIAIGFAITPGFVPGAFIGLIGALPISVSPLPEIGYRLGVVFLAVSITALTLAPIGGAILQASANGWLDVKIFGGVLCLAGSAIILVSRLLYPENDFFFKSFKGENSAFTIFPRFSISLVLTPVYYYLIGSLLASNLLH
ncbi:major facilitator superfamily domain-containing protein [Ustulina deusta]|nr:major facilitator superfamily domain-containing protein [Ustulina deusta]